MEEKRKTISNQSGQQGAKQPVLSKSKRILFWITMIIFPFAIILLMEAGLRYFGYGGNLDLFIKQKDGRSINYVLNKDFTKRYFYQKGIETVTPLSQTFSAEKSYNTYRIFCLGESSVQGFPYQPNVAFPAMLKNILKTIHSSKNIEVVNCGITAISSFSVLDMEDEVLEKYKPDLLVIYTGHNEFYGVFGSASRLSLFENRGLVNLFLKFQRWKVFLLARNIANSLFGRDINEGPAIHRGTMMGIVAKDASIRFSDDIFRRANETFRKNIEDMIVDSREHKTDIIICNLISNIKDFPPFASLHSSSFDLKYSGKWDSLIADAELYRKNKEYKTALGKYLQLVGMDSAYAGVHYQIGRCYYDEKVYDLAMKHFDLARDYDVIRFRAPSSFNISLSNVCKEHSVPLVNVQSDFEQQSEHGIVGDELILEHVHPNQIGYLQIAKNIAKVMSANGLIENKWDWSRNLTDSSYYAMCHLTPLDIEVVHAVLEKLTSHWPYTDVHKKYFKRVSDERTAQLAKSFVADGNKSVERLHLDYGAILQKEKRFSDALAEYEAVLALQPASEVYNRIGQIYLAKTEIAYKDIKDYQSARNNFEKADSIFRQGLHYWPDDLELNLNLGILYFMRNDKLKDAEKEFIRVLELNPSHQNSLTLLSQVYLRQRRYQDAENLLHKAIASHPTQSGYYTDLGIVLLQENRLGEAKINFEKAINLNNDVKAQRLIQAVNAKLKNAN